MTKALSSNLFMKGKDLWIKLKKGDKVIEKLSI